MRLNGEQDQKQQKQRAGKPERDRCGELPAQQLQRQTDQQKDPDPLEHDRPRLQHIQREFLEAVLLQSFLPSA